MKKNSYNYLKDTLIISYTDKEIDNYNYIKDVLIFISNINQTFIPSSLSNNIELPKFIDIMQSDDKLKSLILPYSLNIILGFQIPFKREDYKVVKAEKFYVPMKFAPCILVIPRGCTTIYLPKFHDIYEANENRKIPTELILNEKLIEKFKNKIEIDGETVLDLKKKLIETPISYEDKVLIKKMIKEKVSKDPIIQWIEEYESFIKIRIVDLELIKTKLKTFVFLNIDRYFYINITIE